MAVYPILGNWAITWSDSSHKGTGRQHLLRVPFQRVQPGIRISADVAESLDLSVEERIVYGSAYEVTAMVRAEHNLQSIADLAEAGMRGRALTVVDLDQPERTVDVLLRDPAGLWLAAFDPDSAYREHEFPITLKKADGSRLPDWLLYRTFGTHGLLFRYVPGMDLSDAEFERAGSANYTDVNGDTQSAGVDVARDGHYQTVNGVWTRTLRMDVSTSEACYFPFAHDPQDLTIYIKAVERGTISTASARYWGIGGGTGSSSSCIVLYQVSGTTIGIAHNNSADSWNTGGTIATSHSAGEVLEACVTFDVTNAEMRLYAAVDGGAISASSALALTSIASAWETDILTLNAWGSAGANDLGAVDVVEFKVAAGVQSMSTMRSL